MARFKFTVERISACVVEIEASDMDKAEIVLESMIGERPIDCELDDHNSYEWFHESDDSISDLTFYAEDFGLEDDD